MSKKAVAIVGGIAGLVGLSWLIGRALAKPMVLVALTSNPIRTVLLIDDKIEVVTPRTIGLSKGKHKFSAVPKSPDLFLTYGFDKWSVNRQAVSYEPTVEINITRPLNLTANYLVIESGVYPIVSLP